jgi:hypothetical protein
MKYRNRSGTFCVKLNGNIKWKMPSIYRSQDGQKIWRGFSVVLYIQIKIMSFQQTVAILCKEAVSPPKGILHLL